jgi:hypothetical protein
MTIDDLIFLIGRITVEKAILQATLEKLEAKIQELSDQIAASVERSPEVEPDK